MVMVITINYTTYTVLLWSAQNQLTRGIFIMHRGNQFFARKLHFYWVTKINGCGR